MNPAPTPPSPGPVSQPFYALMDRSPAPMAELAGERHAIRYANAAFCRLTGKSQEALAGQPFAQTVPEGDECLPALDRVYRTGDAEIHKEPEQPGPHLYRSYLLWPVMGEEKHPAGVVIQVTETAKFHRDTGAMNEALLISSVQQHENTEAAEKLNDLLRAEMSSRQRAEEQLQRAFDFDEAVMTNMSEGLYTTDRDGLVTSMNPAAEAMFGRRLEEVRGRNMHDITHHGRAYGTPRPAGECAACRVVGTGDPVTDQLGNFIRKDGSCFPVVYSSAPLREGKNVVGAVVVFRDTTERKRAEERERMLAKELAHRNRNLLAIIQAIVARSLTNQHSMAENRSALMRRLEALARSQKVLESGGFEGAPLAEIIGLELDAFPGRYQAAGPDVALNAKAAQTFALLVHELATNATKHGALSHPNGRIGIEWSVEGEHAEARFKFRWLERGGPPVVLPSREGFGRVLIEKVAAQEFGAKPQIGFEPEGLSYEIEAPLWAVAANAPAARDSH